MAQTDDTTRRLWSIILASGDDIRLQNLIRWWKGRHIPKQYCTFVGSRSPLQHTLARADQITFPANKITVIARSHLHEAFQQFDHSPGKVVIQPLNKDTVAGVFFPLTYIRAVDPSATVIIYPSDHFIFPESPFVNAVHQSVAAIQQLPKNIVLFGVPPDRPDLEYGWIYPGETLLHENGIPVRAVQTFIENPTVHGVQHAIKNGALWNTFIMTATVSTLWELGWRFFPETLALFEKFQKTINTPMEPLTLEDIYRQMPRGNFLSDLLQKVPQHIGVMELNGMLWSDWGQPDRIVETLARIGRKPSFLNESSSRKTILHSMTPWSKKLHTLSSSSYVLDVESAHGLHVLSSETHQS